MRGAIFGAVLLAAMLGFAVRGATTVQAHAALERSEPAQGAVLPVSPPRVLLEFSEPIEMDLADIRVIGTQGVVVGKPALTPSGKLGVEFPLPPLPNGSYAVVIRVVSAADGHPTAASISFTVGEPSGPLVVDTAAGGPPRAVQAAAKFFGFLVATGLWAFAVLGWFAAARHRERPRPGTIAWAIAGLVVAAVLAALLVQCWIAAGAFGDVDGGTFKSVLQTHFGRWWYVRAAAALVAAAVLVRATRRGIAAPDAGVLAFSALAFGLTMSANSHLSAEQGSGFLPELTDWAHFSAATAWIGGLAALVSVNRREQPATTPELGRFTRLAAPAVVVLVASGVVGWLWLVGGVSDLWGSGYGRLVLLKVGLLLPMLALGAAHFVSGRGRAAKLPGFLQKPGLTLVAECTLGVCALGVAGFLSSTPPAGEAVAGAPAHLVIAGANGSVSAELTVSPGRTGNNTFAVKVKGTEVDQLAFQISLESSGIEALSSSFQPDGSGGLMTPPLLLPLPGNWEAVVTVTPKSGVPREIRFAVPIR